MEKEFDYEEYEKDKKKIAQTIWDSPFHSGLIKLANAQLLTLIDSLVEKLDLIINLKNDYYDERDFKDKFFDQKCIMIECLDPDFFKEMKHKDVSNAYFDMKYILENLLKNKGV